MLWYDAELEVVGSVTVKCINIINKQSGDFLAIGPDHNPRFGTCRPAVPDKWNSQKSAV